MKKHLTMTTAMAAALLALPACSSGDDWNDDVVADSDTAVCVDKDGVRVDDSQCAPQRTVTNNYHSGGGMGNAFLWYYIGRNSAVPYYGDSVREPRFSGGSYKAQPNTHYNAAPASSRMTRSAAVSRGGMGSSGHGYGGGRS